MSIGPPSAILGVLIGCLLLSGCSDEAQCLRLDGGFMGADIQAIEAECHASGGIDCDAEDYLEWDQLVCLAGIDEPDEARPTLLYVNHHFTPCWRVYLTPTTSTSNFFSATTAEYLYNFVEE